MINILIDGEDPIVISGNRDKFQVPRPKNSSTFIEGTWEMRFNGETREVYFPGGSTYDIRFLVVREVIKYLDEKNIVPGDDDTYLIYEIKADNKTLTFELEITTAPIELDLESNINIDKETLKNSISNLINYE